MEQIVNIPISELTESPFNHRQVFNESSLQELAADIKAQGRVLSPLLIRPTWTNTLRMDVEPSDGHEIVFGHRRYRAAKIAGLAQIPCMVRRMTTEEVKRAQISENLQREDVHPIEEAEGFQALMKDHGVTAEQLVEQTGKSRSYIYGRLVLLKACPEVRRACLRGEVGSEVALLLARLRTDKLQTKALAQIKSKYYNLEDGGEKSYRQIRELLKENFTLELKGAMFDTGDMMLLPDAGACTTCPKRAGNAPEYDDLASDRKSNYGSPIKGSADICTDPDCFDAKKKAHLRAAAAALESNGKTVIEGNKARAAVSANGEVKGAYVALKDVKSALAKVKKERKSLSGAPLEIATVLIQDPRTGKTHEAVEVKELQLAGVKVAEPDKKVNHQANYQQQETARLANEAKAKDHTAANIALLQRVRAAISARPRDAFDLGLVARTCLAGVQYNDKDTLANIWNFKSAEHLQSKVGSMSVSDLTLLMMDCALIGSVRVQYYHLKNRPEALLAAAKHYGIDLAEPKPSTPDPAAQAPEDRPSEELAEA